MGCFAKLVVVVVVVFVFVVGRVLVVVLDVVVFIVIAGVMVARVIVVMVITNVMITLVVVDARIETFVIKSLATVDVGFVSVEVTPAWIVSIACVVDKTWYVSLVVRVVVPPVKMGAQVVLVAVDVRVRVSASAFELAVIVDVLA